MTQPDLNTTELSDEELMAAIARRAESAFEALYDRYASTLYAICLRVLRVEADAADVLSEVFFEVWDKSSRFSALRGSARSYLVTLTRCRSVDRLRSIGSRANQLKKLVECVEGGLTHGAQDNIDPSDAMAGQENVTALRTAVDSLADVQRDVLMAAYFDGLTQIQIAEKLNLPLGTVKTAIKRGLERLRQSLAASNDERIAK